RDPLATAARGLGKFSSSKEEYPMVKYTRLTAASLAIATLTLAACKGDAAKQDSLKKDSALAANLALASADSASKLTLSDTAKGGGMTKAPAVTRTTKKTAPPPKTT